jgi:hypothetical protein
LNNLGEEPVDVFIFFILYFFWFFLFFYNKNDFCGKGNEEGLFFYIVIFPEFCFVCVCFVLFVLFCLFCLFCLLFQVASLVDQPNHNATKDDQSDKLGLHGKACETRGGVGDVDEENWLDFEGLFDLDGVVDGLSLELLLFAFFLLLCCALLGGEDAVNLRIDALVAWFVRAW